MKTTTKFFMGIDVSKPYFDATLMTVENHQKQEPVSGHFSNDEAGIKLFDKWLKQHKVLFDENTLLVMENTGIYHRNLWAYCSKKKLPIHIGNAAHMKWSFGIARGKNDKMDAKRLCSYAYRHADELKATPALDPVLMQLKDLMTSRSKLLGQASTNKTYIKELRSMNDKAAQAALEKAYKNAIEGIARSIKDIEALIAQIIAQNGALKLNYELLVTVPPASVA